MMAAFQSAQLFLLASAAFLIIGFLGTAGLVWLCGDRVLHFEPRARHRALLFLAFLPVFTASVLLFAASLPSLIALLAPGLDHCPTHNDGHAHLCFVHLPKLHTNMPLVLGLVFFTSYMVIRIALSAVGILRASRVLRALARTGVRHPALDATILETTQPLCFAAGLLHPQVFVSRGLLDSLNDDDRAIVVAHEQAHVRRRDALITNIVRVCAAIHIPTVASWLIRELEIAAEQICDDAASTLAGDRLAVAEVILTVERAAQHAASRKLGALAVAFGECAVERRVKALLGGPLPAPSPRPLYAGFALAALALLVSAGALHHATESLLSLITH